MIEWNFENYFLLAAIITCLMILAIYFFAMWGTKK